MTTRAGARAVNSAASSATTGKRVYKSLQYFLNRSSVLAQYREFLRATRPLAPDTRRDVRHQIRAGFEAQRQEADERRVAQLLRGAREQLKMVGDLVDTATARQRAAEMTTAAASTTDSMTSRSPLPKAEIISTKASKADGATFGNVVQHNSASVAGTWMEPSGDDAESDVKGRVGTGWPWKSSRPPKKLELEGIKRRYGTRSFLEDWVEQ